eukprot:jgi/Tetstr1/444621/TSEL_032469.t1
MDREIASITKMETFVWISIPELRRDNPSAIIIQTAWAFAEKQDKDGNLTKRKARVVVRGDQLTAGENYDDTKTYAPVVSFIALRTTIALAVQLDWELYQFDAPKAWFLRFSSFLRDFGFVSSECDPGVWTLLAVDKSLLAILCVYVDDIMLAASPSSDIRERFQTSLFSTFDATTDGLCTWLLGMAIDRKPEGVLHLHQEKYINDILTTFNMAACAPRRLPCTPDTDFHDPTVAYRAQVQKSVALSTAEAEFVALCMACKCLAFIRVLLRQLHHPTTDPVRVCEDNQACIVQVKHGMITSAQRHIDLKFQYAAQLCQDGVIDMHYTPTADQLADFFTKALPLTTFLRFRAFLMGTSSLPGTKRPLLEGAGSLLWTQVVTVL